MSELKKVRIGAVGLGGRGRSMLGLLLQVPGVVCPAVCDKVPERVEEGIDVVESVPGMDYEVHGYTDYKEMIANEELDALFIATTWITHAKIAIAGMNAGLNVAMEVGGAASIEECWEMVRTSERTGKFCMLLENCCYDRKEMAVFKMVKEGLFGEIVNCEGGYRHDLRDEISLGRENIHGRLYNFQNRNGELYPTHQIGPISKVLGINRGNRYVSLVSVASKSRGLNEWIGKNKGTDYDLYGYDFAEGDVVTTILKCAHGETVTIYHDCCLPRPYSRNYVVQGTKGIFMEISDRNSLLAVEGLTESTHEWEHLDKHIDKLDHPLWCKYTKDGIKAGHGGMDYLVLSAFVEAARDNLVPPIDVYDTATWMAITCLSEQSVAMGGHPVAFPDFTNGAWIDREPYRRGVYCLDEVCDDFFTDKEEEGK
ncbi:MAG: Gfo/Idh/MocA family oxidoreductase [Clostridia bacterium]|nr:Gfo/Idh/MocA family oxidoreductase [Clostridia bacterium]